MRAPVPQQVGLEDKHQHSKIHGERGLKYLGSPVQNFEKKGVSLGKIFTKVKKKRPVLRN